MTTRPNDRNGTRRGISDFVKSVFWKIVARRRWILLPLWVLLALAALLILISGGSSILPVIYIGF